MLRPLLLTQKTKNDNINIGVNKLNELPKRKQIRLKYYDYSHNGYYFVTICTKEKKNVFGKIISGKLVLNNFGKIAFNEMQSVNAHYRNVEIDKFVIMPNHLHCIIIIGETGAASGAPTVNGGKPTLGDIVRGYKSAVSRKCKFSIWQRGYYEHIIRNDNDYIEVYKYIDENPMKWEYDKYYE